MEALLSLLGGAAAAAVIYGLKRLGAGLVVARFGSVIEKVYEVLDPIAAQLIASYSESTVRDAIDLIVYRVADNNLSEEDALAIAHFVADHFDVYKAAGATLNPESPEGSAAIEISKLVKDLTDGASKEELIKLVRAAAALF